MIQTVWVFSGVPTSSEEGRFLDQIWNLNVTDVAFMMNDIGQGGIRPLGWAANAVVRIAGNLFAMGVTTHLVTWLWPDEANLQAAAEQFGPLCAGLQASLGGSLLFDAENNWRQPLQRQARLRRTSVLEAARAALVNWRFNDWSLNMGVTGPAQIGSADPDGNLPPARAALQPLVELCNYVLPQAYPLIVNGVNIPQRAHRLWRSFKKPIVMGLTANPAVIGNVADMRRAIAVVESLAIPVVKQVSYWHLQKFIAANPARFAFVQEAAARARQGLPQAGDTSGSREMALAGL
jgi:hypothetical protein